jgi:hypothetical protein
MPLTSTFLDEETMDGCIRKAIVSSSRNVEVNGMT